MALPFAPHPVRPTTALPETGRTHLGALALALLLAACGGGGGGGGGGSGEPSSPPPTGSATRSEGCSREAATGEVNGLSARDGEGRDRQFALVVPSDYDRERPLPVVFVFHALDGSITEARNYGVQTAIAAEGDRAIVVLPQGIAVPGAGVGWDLRCGGRDTAFYDAMLAQVKERYCVDTNRVFATGFSFGADMTNVLSCCRGDTLKGVAPFSGASTDANASCPAQRIPALRFRYGTGAANGGDGAYSLDEFLATTDFYRQAQGCSDQSDTAGRCRSWRGCAAPVTACAIPDIGHAPPSVDELRQTWRFWKQLP